MSQSSFWFGYVTAILLSSVLEDVIGQERVVETVRLLWLPWYASSLPIFVLWLVLGALVAWEVANVNVNA